MCPPASVQPAGGTGHVTISKCLWRTSWRMKRHVLALLLTGPLAQPACAQTEADLRADPRFSSPLACMTAAIYYEARGEPAEGQAAVAAVVLNRMAHPAYPKSVCAVVLQGAGRATGCQFTFTCDGSLQRQPEPARWAAAQAVAAATLAGAGPRTTDSTHYHSLAVSPAWAASLTPTVQLGHHRFYRLPAKPGTALAAAKAAPAYSPWGLALPQ